MLLRGAMTSVYWSVSKSSFLEYAEETAWCDRQHWTSLGWCNSGIHQSCCEVVASIFMSNPLSSHFKSTTDFERSKGRHILAAMLPSIVLSCLNANFRFSHIELRQMVDERHASPATLAWEIHRNKIAIKASPESPSRSVKRKIQKFSNPWERSALIGEPLQIATYVQRSEVFPQGSGSSLPH